MDKQIIISRVFDASREKVWDAWTNPEMVKKWWGPKDFYAPSIKIDFRVGGKYIYAMHGPVGTPFDKDMYSAGEFKEIVPMERLVVTDYFSDESGEKMAPEEQGLPEGMPSEMEVVVTFEDVAEGKTKLSITYTATTEAMYNAMIASRMEEGWNTSLDKLADALR